MLKSGRKSRQVQSGMPYHRTSKAHLHSRTHSQNLMRTQKPLSQQERQARIQRHQNHELQLKERVTLLKQRKKASAPKQRSNYSLSNKDSQFLKHDTQMAELETLLHSQPNQPSSKKNKFSHQKLPPLNQTESRRPGTSLPQIPKKNAYYSERTLKGKSQRGFKPYQNSSKMSFNPHSQRHNQLSHQHNGSRVSFDIKQSPSSNKNGTDTNSETQTHSAFPTSSFRDKIGDSQSKAMTLISRFDRKFGDKKATEENASSRTHSDHMKNSDFVNDDELSDEGNI